ncbi:aminotransferase class III-fold pyridoxal phosphate-dependent enzyme [Pseudomonas sp. HK3]|jgi:glutamate-1-semialdehyde 2,1-aminomutase
MRYTESNEHLRRALESIPTGSQTFSKSYYSLPKGAAPLFIEKGEGAHVWDVDDNEYIDLVNGLLSVSLGYCNKDVDQAIKAQLKKGITFSLPHRLEAQVAEKLIDMIPCAEMVRFGKNGTDATSAAIRLARAFTGKSKIAICGYHGWQDWYIGTTTRNLGVPSDTSKLSVCFQFNDIDSLIALFEENEDIAAVILEPMSSSIPDLSFLKGIKSLCEKNKAILIFDEMITGFRFHNGGAQALFGVTPDLATFGKGMANGMPISAVVGRSEIMLYMDKIFYSGTFGGETLSLAAANCVIDIYRHNPVVEHLSYIGKLIFDGVIDLVKLHNINWFSLVGHNSWKIMSINHQDEVLIKSVIIQELCEKGVLTIGTHNISYAMTNNDVEHVLAAYDHALPLINSAIKKNSLEQLLKGEKIQPVFKLR